MIQYHEMTLAEAIKFVNYNQLSLVSDGYDNSAMTDICNDIDNRFNHKNILVNVAKCNNDIVGWAWLVPRNHDNWISYRDLSFMIFVSSNYRMMGIGKDLFAWAKNVSRKRKRKLIVFPWSPESRSFYKNLKVKPQNQEVW